MQNIINKIRDKFAREKISVGLDIGKQTVKVVKLKSIKGKLELLNFDYQIVNSGIDKVLRDIKNSWSIDTANIGFSGPATVIRYVNFPRMNPAEFKQALKYEAKKHIPFPITEVNCDGYILKDGLADNKMFVLIAAVRKEIVNERLKLMGDLGIKVNIIDMASLALSNAFTFNYTDAPELKDKSVALLNIGLSLINLNILENGIIHFSRDINFDLNSIVSADTNPQPAPTVQQGAIVENVNSSLGRLADEIKPSFDYYESQKGVSIGKIFLSGETNKVVGFKEKLSEGLGVAVEYWDPLHRLDIAKGLDTTKLKGVASQLGIAIGLALRQ